ncbi:MAG: aldo/keto reductase [Deltaproteobacteria bacterium]|nr:aldo/keto reductase [Deltaproteobacteria bacterium]MBW2153841.1 aldo/keto reductase [Deltaproteobacteria bacterium]
MNQSGSCTQQSIDAGITFSDSAWGYHGGRSEELMGRALETDGRREKVFLMTKNCERDYEGSMQNLEESLRRLKTDYVDLWQFHEIIYDNDPALEAFRTKWCRCAGNGRSVLSV